MADNQDVAANPQTPTPEPQAEPKETMEGLLAELKSHNIQEAKDLQNVVTASAQAGKLANQVGDLKQQLNEATRMIQSLQNQPRQMEYGEEPQSVDLGQLVESKVQGVLERHLQNERRAQDAYFEEMGSIRSNPRYAQMEKMFETHLQSPDTQMKLRSGQTTLTNEFNNLTFTYYDTLLSRVTDVMGNQPQVTKPPHVESADTHAPVVPTTDDERTDTIRRTVKARQEGTRSSDDAMKDIVKAFLPTDDPIWRR